MTARAGEPRRREAAARDGADRQPPAAAVSLSGAAGVLLRARSGRGIGPGSKRTWTPEQAKAWAAEHAEGVPKSDIARRDGYSADAVAYAIRCATGQHRNGATKRAGVSPRELAVQLAGIACARIARGDEPLIDGRTFRRAQTVSAGLSGRGLVHEVESALMYLEARGLVHAERPDAAVSMTRPQRYRWSSPRWLEMARRFVRLETARGLGDVAIGVAS